MSQTLMNWLYPTQTLDIKGVHCVSKNGILSGPWFPAFALNTGKYRPETTPYLDTFHAVVCILYRINGKKVLNKEIIEAEAAIQRCSRLE